MEPVRPSLLATALLAACLANGPASVAGPARVERRVAVMGTWLDEAVEHDGGRPAALRASEAALRALAEVEARLSTWDPGSELSRLNATPVGEPFAMSPALASDLRRARELWLATGGAFDPGLGALVEAWGLRTGGRVPTAAEVADARAGGGFESIELAGNVARRTHALAWIEEGGFGKGIGLDAALATLRESGVRSAVLDLGGQVSVLGSAPVERRLSDPRDRERPVLAITLGPGSLSTTGNSERGFTADGERYGHVLDPRTGEPAPDFGSLTVSAPDALTADALSTGLYVLGPEGAFRWLAAQPGERTVELIVLEPRGDGLLCTASAGWRERLRALVPDLELRFVQADPSGAAFSSSLKRP